MADSEKEKNSPNYKEILIHYQKPHAISEESLQNRHRHYVRNRSLSQYAVSLPQQPTDVSVVQPKDDHYRFFAKGRDFQPHSKQHKYTTEEFKILETYEGSSRLPSNSKIYKEWSSSQHYNALEKVSWGSVILIALAIGVLSFGMKELCEKLQIFYNPFIKDYVKRGQPYRLFMYHAGISCTFVAMSSIICVYFCPWAAGSGIPEIICILNGTVVRNMLTFKTLVCKTISISFAVLSGLPIGFEGPMVHIGAMIGALLSRPATCKFPCRSKRVHGGPRGGGRGLGSGSDEIFSMHNARPFSKYPCCRYRDSEERHSLICIGAACGIASAFSAPISAILFVIEEISTHWSAVLTWKTFVCCIVARSVTELLRGTISGIFYSENFSFMELSEAAVFDQVKEGLTLNLLIVIPTVIIGVVGGFLGAFFIILHLKMAKYRRRVLGAISNIKVLSLVKVLEPVSLALLSTVIIMGTLPYFECKPFKYEMKTYNKDEGKFLVFHAFRCDKQLVRKYRENTVIQSGEYHEAATLLFGSWEQMVRNLLSRRTPNMFSIPVLVVILLFFFIVSSWAALTCIASGLLIPQLAIGALYGRILGVLTHDLVKKYVNADVDSTGNLSLHEKWEWIDPGAFALLGAASFMAGITRLPVTTVVMMIEMTNDVNMVLLIMIVVMVSKAIGDHFTHPFYHSLIEFKCIPFLELELDIVCRKKKLNLDLFQVGDIMAKPVHYINNKESIQVLANILLDTNHGGFPVVMSARGLSRTFLGMITRMELTVLLTKTAAFNADELHWECRERIRLSYPDYSTTRIKDTLTTNLILNNFAADYHYRHVTVNLMPYVNTSAFSVKRDMSLLRAYRMFRSLGLRHLVVTDYENQVVGIITKKDLMGFVVVNKLKQIITKTKNSHSHQEQNPKQDWDQGYEYQDQTNPNAGPGAGAGAGNNGNGNNGNDSDFPPGKENENTKVNNENNGMDVENFSDTDNNFLENFRVSGIDPNPSVSVSYPGPHSIAITAQNNNPGTSSRVVRSKT